MTTVEFIQSISPGATFNLDLTKGYYLINYTGVTQTKTNDIGIRCIERNTGRILDVPLYAIMHLDGKKWSSVTYYTGGGTVYICEDIVDIPSLYEFATLPNAMNNIINSNTNAVLYNGILAISTSAISVWQMPENDPYPYTMYYSCYGAASGEVDTINIYDVGNNLFQSINATGQQNQKVIIPLSWNGATGDTQPFVDVVASGVTTATGKLSVTIYRGAL